MFAASAVVALLAAAIFIVLLVSVRQLRNSARLENHSGEVIATANRSERLLIYLQTGARGFLLTDQDRFLDPWRQGRREMPGALRKLTRLVSDNPEQERLAQEIQALSRAYVSEYSIHLVATGRRSVAHGVRIVGTGEGRTRVNAIRDLYNRLLDNEESLRVARGQRADASSQRAATLGVAGLAALIGLLVLLAFYLARSIVKPVRLVAAAADQLAGGDLSARVPVRGTDDTAVLGRSFNAMAAQLERQRDELELKRAEFEQLFQFAPDGILQVDSDGRLVQVNSRIEELFGYQREELLGQPVEKLLPERFHERHVGHRATYFEDPVMRPMGQELDLYARCKDGSEFPVEITLSALELESGTFAMAILRDISELRAAQSDSERFFKVSTQLLCTAGFDGYFKRLSPAWETVLGYSLEELKDRPFIEFVHPDDRAATEAEAAKQTEAGADVISFENRYRCKDGSYRWLLWSSTPVEDQQLLYAGARDITDRKQMDEERITQQQRLEQLNHELEAFSYSVSHDLRAPLRAIDGFSQALVEDCADALDETGHGHIGRIRAGTERMATLIDDLLGLARVSRAKLNLIEIDLSAHARGILERLQESEPEREADFTIDEDLTVRADLRLLDIVLENLLGNAWKFTAGRERTSIELGGERDNGGPPGFYVRDNGAGFDMAYADKLFGAFQRLHSQHEFEGTGIGLATVERAVSKHGGRVWASAEPDRGATFHFTLEQRSEDR